MIDSKPDFWGHKATDKTVKDGSRLLLLILWEKAALLRPESIRILHQKMLLLQYKNIKKSKPVFHHPILVFQLSWPATCLQWMAGGRLPAISSSAEGTNHHRSGDMASLTSTSAKLIWCSMKTEEIIIQNHGHVRQKKNRSHASNFQAADTESIQNRIQPGHRIASMVQLGKLHRLEPGTGSQQMETKIGFNLLGEAGWLLACLLGYKLVKLADSKMIPSNSIAHQLSVVVVQSRRLRAILWLEAGWNLTQQNQAWKTDAVFLGAKLCQKPDRIWPIDFVLHEMDTIHICGPSSWSHIHHAWQQLTWIYRQEFQCLFDMFANWGDSDTWLPEADEQWLQKSIRSSPVPQTTWCPLDEPTPSSN